MAEQISSFSIAGTMQIWRTVPAHSDSLAWRSRIGMQVRHAPAVEARHDDTGGDGCRARRGGGTARSHSRASVK